VVVVTQLSRTWLYGAGGLVAVGALFRSELLFGMGVLLVLVLGVAWLWARWCLLNFTVERRFSQSRAFFGEEIELTHVFTNAKPLPIPWLVFEDEFPASLNIPSPAVANSDKPRRNMISTTLSLGWYEWITRRYEVQCLARGAHEFGPIEVQSGDVFGLFRRSEVLPATQTLLVYPRYVPVERLGIPARQPFGEFKAVQNLAADPLRLRGVREYTYGDNPRHIHWKATARRAALQTKLFEPGATPYLFVFCNQDTFARMWEGLDRDTLELTITVAASVANHALEEGYMVGLQVNALAEWSDTHIKVPASRDPQQLTRILESLARVIGWSGVSMEELIRAERLNLPWGATIVVVTGVVTDEMLGVLLALRGSGYPVTLIATAASDRAREQARGVSASALRAQGITCYFVDTMGDSDAERTAAGAASSEVVQIERLSF
jgi:uncharacterized protein (DUF58 family)